MDLQDLVAAIHEAQEEENALEELDKEIVLFDIEEELETSSLDSEDLESLLQTQHDSPVQITPSPAGISFFSRNAFTLYKEDSLVWPVQHLTDSFLKMVNPCAVNDLINIKYFMRQMKSSDVLVRYLLHTLCVTSSEQLRLSAYDTLLYLLDTSDSFPHIKDDLFLAFLNMGADLRVLKKNVLSCRSCVLPPPSHRDTRNKTHEMPDTQLRHVMLCVLCIMSHCLKKDSTYTCKDTHELLRLFAAVALEPKLIDKALETHIGTCISHTLAVYPSESHFLEGLQGVVEGILEYCKWDLCTVLFLCEGFIIQTHRGGVLRKALAFQQLRVYLLKLSGKDFVADVQVKDVAGLVTAYFQTCAEVTDAYDSYYIVKLLDLCLNMDTLQAQERCDLSVICDLVEHSFHRSQGTPDDMNPTIAFQNLTNTLYKWKRYCQALQKKTVCVCV